MASMTAPTNASVGRPPNETAMSMPIDILLVGTVAYTIVFLVGVLGNLSVVIVLMRNKELRNCTNFFLANLSIADLLVLFACVPSGLHDLYAQEGWYLGQLTCYLISFIENCMGIASILSILFISCERFFVICKPLSVRTVMTQSRTLKVIAFIWLLSIGINVPFIHLSDWIDDEFIDKSIRKKCLVRSDTGAAKLYFVVVTFVIYLIIGIVLMCIYYKISEILKKSTMLFLPAEATPMRSGSITGASSAPAAAAAFNPHASSYSMNSRPFGAAFAKQFSTYSMSSFKNQNHNKQQQNHGAENTETAAVRHRSGLLNRAKDALLCRRRSVPEPAEEARLAQSLRKRGTYFKSSQGNLILFQQKAAAANGQRSEPSMSRSGSVNGACAGPANCGGGGGGFRGSISSPENFNLNINNNVEKYLKPRRQLIKMLMCVIVAFYVCIFPLKIWNLFLIFVGTDEEMAQAFFGTIQLRGFWYINITFRLFFYSNSSINPLLYNCLSKKFRQSFKRLFFSSRLCFCFKNKCVGSLTNGGAGGATPSHVGNATLNNSIYTRTRAGGNPRYASSNAFAETYAPTECPTPPPPTSQAPTSRPARLLFRLFSRSSARAVSSAETDEDGLSSSVRSPTTPQTPSSHHHHFAALFESSKKKQQHNAGKQLPAISERYNSTPSQSQSHIQTPSQSQCPLAELRHELEEAPLSL